MEKRVVNSKIMYFDFDRTLIDTDALKVEQSRRVAQNTGLTIEQVNDGMKQYIASIHDHLDFAPESYAKYLASLY